MKRSGIEGISGLLLMVFMFFSFGVNAQEASAVAGEGPINHVVVVWFNEPGDADAQKRFLATTKSFAKLPGVIGHSAGSVLKSERKVADSSFDMAVVVTLKNKQALQDYLDHPVHKKALQEVLKPMMKKVVVYDYLVQ